MEGWISLHRQFLNWEWYENINTKCLFLHLLLVANHKDKKWRGKLIKRGQKFTSVKTLSHDLKLSEKQIRNALKKLIKTGEIKIQGSNNGTLITLCNYSTYQDYSLDKGEQKVKRRAIKGQTKGKQRATNNNDNNVKNDNNVNKLYDYIYTDYNLEKYGKEVLSEFHDYWTETKMGGTKTLYELQKTFDVGRRLASWVKRDFNGTYANHIIERKVKLDSIKQQEQENKYSEESDPEEFNEFMKNTLKNIGKGVKGD